MELEEPFSDLSNISNATSDEWITLARGYSSLLTLVGSLVFFVSALYNLARKSTRYHKNCNCCCVFFVRYVANPFFLLAFVSLLPLAAYSIVLHHPQHNGYALESTFCEGWPGYVLVWFESAETLALSVFSLYFLFYYIPFHNRIPLVTETTELIGNRNKELPVINVRFICHSIISILCFVAIFAICGVYTMPPVVERAITNGTYGKDGPWCWIASKNAQIHFWFIEEWAYMLISFAALSSSLAVLCCVTREVNAKYRCFPNSIWWNKTIFVPFFIFYTYFMMQFVLVVIEIIIQLFDKETQWLWYIYAVGKPVSKILVVVASLQLMSTSYRTVKNKQNLLSHDADTVDT